MRLKSLMGIVGAVALSATMMGCGGSTTKKQNDMAVSPDLNGTGNNSTLTILNYLAWCQVSVNGTPATPAASMPVSLPTGSTVTLSVPSTINNTDFQWGYWQGVSSGADMDALFAGTGSDHSVSFTLDGNLTVKVCCPDVGSAFGTGCSF